MSMLSGSWKEGYVDSGDGTAIDRDNYKQEVAKLRKQVAIISNDNTMLQKALEIACTLDWCYHTPVSDRVKASIKDAHTQLQEVGNERP